MTAADDVAKQTLVEAESGWYLSLYMNCQLFFMPLLFVATLRSFLSNNNKNGIFNHDNVTPPYYANGNGKCQSETAFY